MKTNLRGKTSSRFILNRGLVGVFSIIMCLLTMNTFAQPFSITGKVTDSENNPVPGVNISIQGTTKGSVTDMEGNYTLESDAENVTILYSAVGYSAQEVTASGNTELNIVLIEELTELDELVVIGYGTQKSSLVTGAISRVNNDDIVNSPISRPEQALQGKTAGVMVLPNSGSPGAGMSVRIRGIGTNGNPNPIYIVDGMKAKDLNFLSPNDIESMEILKDGAASAIYGAEGGNGVVIITTKSGTSGKNRVNYSFQYGIQSAGMLPELMNAEEYSQYMNEAGRLSSVDPADYKGKDGTDWMDLITDDANLQKHYLSFDGGNENSNYFASISYLDQDGIIGGDKANFQRITSRLNYQAQVNKYVKFGSNLAYTTSDRAAITEDSEFGGVIASALGIDPLTEPYSSSDASVISDEDGNYFGISEHVGGEILNPLLAMELNTGSTKADNVLGNTFVDITPIKGLTYTSRLGIDYTHETRHFWNPPYNYSSERNRGAGNVEERNFTKKSWQWENYITYTKEIGNSNISAVAGMSAEQLTYRYLNIVSSNMLVDDELYSEIAFTNDTKGDVYGNLFEEKLQSYFGRVSYDYADKYLLQGTIRSDGASTSLVYRENTYGYFPSVSAGWVLSQEDFFPEGFISFAKIRASWGQNGSLANLRGVWKDYDDFSPFQEIENRQFNYLSSISRAGIRYPLSGGGYIGGAEPYTLENKELSWETSQQSNIGLDISFMEGQISFTTDIYSKVTKGLLTIYDPPATAGTRPPFINAGDVKNSGAEFSLNFKNQHSDFKYNIGLNFATMKNEVTELRSDVTMLGGMRVGVNWEEATAFEEGQPIWCFRGYQTDGIDPETGDPIFKDLDGDGQITADDQDYIGDPHPDFIYGGNISLSYKIFDLNIFVQGVQGNDVLIGWVRTDRPTVNKPSYLYEDRWTPTNTDAEMPRAGTGINAFQSDLMVRDGSYFRIKQIQLGVTLPESIGKQAGISKARVFVSLDDYFTFTKYEGMDPEAGSVNDASAGIDKGVYPVPRKVLFGINVTF